MYPAVHSPAEYAAKGREYPFPLPPKRCPHCGRFGAMKKHGFYERYYLGEGYSGKCINKALQMFASTLS
jgi:hypothetical protein